jgi:hypothetical protein
MARNPITSITWRAAIGLTAVLVLASAGTAAAARAKPVVHPPQASTHGATYGEWAARWWQWALGAPVATNPVLDSTGEDCAVGQSGHVWFLAGTFGGTVERTCTIPVGTSLFFPVVNFASIATEPDETEELVHGKVTARANSVDTSLLVAEVDGSAIANLDAYRAHSPTFYVTLPDGNLFGAPAGTYGPAAADGFWLMLAPLPPGTHTVHFGGVLPNGTTVDATYTLQVVTQP